MAITNIGTLIVSPIRPITNMDPIASAFGNEVKGGHHAYETLSSRDAIIEARREWGMLCTVYNDGLNNKTYQLKYGYSSTTITDNLNWIVFSSGGSGGGSGEWQPSVLTRLDDPSLLSPTGGDRYLIKNPSLGDWISNPDNIAEWDGNIGTWSYTEPTNGMTVRVDDEDNSVYKYEGTYSSGVWYKEYISSVRFIYATSSNGLDYTATSDPIFSTYSTYQMFSVVFATNSVGGTTSISINGVGFTEIKKDLGNGTLVNIDPNDFKAGIIHPMYFDGTQFQVTISSGGSSGVIGPAEDSDYTDGLFTDFTPTTPVGTAVDRFNEVLKSLVPQPAPDLRSYSATTLTNIGRNVNGKLSFDNSFPIVSYFSATESNLPVAVDGIWTIGSGANYVKLGIIPTDVNDINGTLNNDVPLHTGLPTPAYVANSFGDAINGELRMIINDVELVSARVVLSTMTSLNTTSGNTMPGFIVSAPTASKFPGGDPFEVFWNRTGTYFIKNSLTYLRNGFNKIVIQHWKTSGTINLKQLEFIIDNNTDPTLIGTPTLTYTLSGSKYLSGINYYATGSLSYDVTIDNLYRNTYVSGNAISFNDTTSGLILNVSGQPTSITQLVNSGGDEAKQYSIVSQNGSPAIFPILSPNKRRYNESISLTTTALRTISNGARNVSTTGGGATISNVLLDNFSVSSIDVGATTSNASTLTTGFPTIAENFDDESRRLLNPNGPLNYDTYAEISSNPWNSNTSLTDLLSPGTLYGLQVGNGILHCGTVSWNTVGNLSTNLNFGISNRNYSGIVSPTVTQRVYTRYFRRVSPPTSNFLMCLDGTLGNGVFKSSDDSTGIFIHVELKMPGLSSPETGWLDCYDDYLFSTADGAGCRNTSLLVGSNLDGRAFNVNWGLSTGIKSTANSNGYVILRIKAHPSWTGNINSIRFAFI